MRTVDDEALEKVLAVIMAESNAKAGEKGVVGITARMLQDTLPAYYRAASRELAGDESPHDTAAAFSAVIAHFIAHAAVNFHSPGVTAEQIATMVASRAHHYCRQILATGTIIGVDTIQAGSG